LIEICIFLYFLPEIYSANRNQLNKYCLLKAKLGTGELGAPAPEVGIRGNEDFLPPPYSNIVEDSNAP
jgi:hypothetical protein